MKSTLDSEEPKYTGTLKTCSKTHIPNQWEPAKNTAGWTGRPAFMQTLTHLP